MTWLAVTRRIYRETIAPAGPVDPHRRRQLDAYVALAAVVDARPAVGDPARPPARVADRIAGEVLT